MPIDDLRVTGEAGVAELARVALRPGVVWTRVSVYARDHHLAAVIDDRREISRVAHEIAVEEVLGAVQLSVRFDRAVGVGGCDGISARDERAAVGAWSARLFV